MKCQHFGRLIVLTVTLIFQHAALNFAQLQPRDFRVHDRGMLHQTVYNTGELSQGWSYGGHETHPDFPLMEWPPYLYRAIGSEEFWGTHNCFGGAVWISANELGIWGYTENTRLHSFSGGVGKSEPDPPPFGLWSFPISIDEVHNYPLNEDGTLNQDYNPDEAEEIITAKWATYNTGITIERVSRQWSYPDYDDFIIYEYTFTNTGDLDGDDIPDTTRTLADVLIQFRYGLSPSSYGRKRYGNEFAWRKDDDNAAYWDPSYWLIYTQSVAPEQFADPLRAGHPEIIPEDFARFAQTGQFGGGLMSPQAAGYSILYYDTDKLSIIDPVDAARNQSYQVVHDGIISFDSTGYSDRLDALGRAKQPWMTDRSKGKIKMPVDALLEKNHSFHLSTNNLYVDPATSDSIAAAEQWLPDPKWIGRRYIFDSGNDDRAALGMGFGPYYLEPGESVRFSTAEVVGFGGRPDHPVVGGLEVNAFNQPVLAEPWDLPVEVEKDGVTVRYESYLNDVLLKYGYPDYVNSDVISVQDVTHKAFEAYTGREIPMPNEWTPGSPQCWPEDNPAHGVYRMPIPIPAPKIEVVNTDTGTVTLRWDRDVEDFENKFPERITGKLAKFYIYRADFAMGPWSLLDSLELGETVGLEYEYADIDRSFKVAETKYYAVTSVDEYGNQSGKTNFTKHEKNIGPASNLGKVYVVPNPFVVESSFTGENTEHMLGFYGLPSECTVYIYSFAGQLVHTMEHDVPEYSTNWTQLTINKQDLASGVYYFVVETPEGEKSHGKFIVIK
ncbi:hypothetical protein BVY01_05090 [bacterium I07]|nr:hypothetical protein BVY01_05090 [bacterium I07]